MKHILAAVTTLFALILSGCTRDNSTVPEQSNVIFPGGGGVAQRQRG